MSVISAAARQQQLAGVGQQQATGGAHEQRGAERAFGASMWRTSEEGTMPSRRAAAEKLRAGHVEKIGDVLHSGRHSFLHYMQKRFL